VVLSMSAEFSSRWIETNLYLCCGVLVDHQSLVPLVVFLCKGMLAGLAARECIVPELVALYTEMLPRELTPLTKCLLM